MLDRRVLTQSGINVKRFRAQSMGKMKEERTNENRDKTEMIRSLLCLTQKHTAGF